MSFLMAGYAEGDQILGRVIAQSTSRQNVMDLKILHAPARLTTPSIPLQDFSAEPAISFRIKPHGRTIDNPFCLQSKSTSLSDLMNGLVKGMPTASRVFTNSTACANML
jgi:hypothetical protein